MKGGEAERGKDVKGFVRALSGRPLTELMKRGGQGARDGRYEGLCFLVGMGRYEGPCQGTPIEPRGREGRVVVTKGSVAAISVGHGLKYCM